MIFRSPFQPNYSMILLNKIANNSVNFTLTKYILSVMKYSFLSFKCIAPGCHRRKAEPIFLFILLGLRSQIQTAAVPSKVRNESVSEFFKLLLSHTAILETETCIT